MVCFAGKVEILDGGKKFDKGVLLRYKITGGLEINNSVKAVKLVTQSTGHSITFNQYEKSIFP